MSTLGSAARYLSCKPSGSNVIPTALFQRVIPMIDEYLLTEANSNNMLEWSQSRLHT